MKRKSRLELPEDYDTKDRKSPWYGITFSHLQDEKHLAINIDDTRITYDESREVMNHGNTICYQTVFLDGEEIALYRGFNSYNFLKSVTVCFIVPLDDEVDDETRSSPHFSDDGEYNELHFATLQQLIDYKLKGTLMPKDYEKQRHVYKVTFKNGYGSEDGIYSLKELSELNAEYPCVWKQMTAKDIGEEIIAVIAKGENYKYAAKSFLTCGFDYVAAFLQAEYPNGGELSMSPDYAGRILYDDFINDVVHYVLDDFPFKRNEYGLLRGTGDYNAGTLFYDEIEGKFRTLEDIGESIAAYDHFERPFTSVTDYLDYYTDHITVYHEEDIEEMVNEWRKEREWCEYLGFNCDKLEVFLHDWVGISDMPYEVLVAIEW